MSHYVSFKINEQRCQKIDHKVKNYERKIIHDGETSQILSNIFILLTLVIKTLTLHICATLKKKKEKITIAKEKRLIFTKHMARRALVKKKKQEI